MKEQANFENQAMDYLSGAMSEAEKLQFEAMLKDNLELQKEYEDLQSMWCKIESLDTPEPSMAMDETFSNFLAKEVGKKEKTSFWTGITDTISPIFTPRFAYGVLLLLLGFGVGYFLIPKESITNREVVGIDEPTEEVRQRLVLTLLEQPSANQRLQGVNEANKINRVDSIVVKALLQTLNSDPNVNVRLAAIESLTNYVDDPKVRQGLVQSIGNQESPIIQVTLANLMVALQEKASIEPFKQLLKEKTLDTTVKKRIKKSIASII